VREAVRITRDTDWLPALLRLVNDSKPESEDIIPVFIGANVPTLTDQTIITDAAE